MNIKTKRLIILGQKLSEKYNTTDNGGGEYGGKGKFELPPDHIAAIQVPKGGSCCKNCEFVDAEKHECKNPHYIKWNGDDPKLPDLPLDEICSDWYGPK